MIEAPESIPTNVPEEVKAETKISSARTPRFLKYSDAAKEAFPSLEGYPELELTPEGIFDKRTEILTTATEVPIGKNGEFNITYRLIPTTSQTLPPGSKLTVLDADRNVLLEAEANLRDLFLQFYFTADRGDPYTIRTEIPVEGSEPIVSELNQETGKVFPYFRDLFQGGESSPEISSEDLNLIEEVIKSKLPTSYPADLIAQGSPDWLKALAPDISLEELETKLKPGGASRFGFMGPNESLEEILERDHEVVTMLYGLTHSKVAAPFMKALEAVQNSSTGTFEHNGERYKVDSFLWRSGQRNPFDEKFYQGSRQDLTVTRLSDGAELIFPGLLPTLIAQVGLYEGVDAEYRLAPERAITFFGLNEISENQLKSNQEDQPNQSVESNQLEIDRARQARSSPNVQQIFQARRLGLPDTASEQQIMEAQVERDRARQIDEQNDTDPQQDGQGGLPVRPKIPQPNSGGGSEAIIEESTGKASRTTDQVTEAEPLNSPTESLNTEGVNNKGDLWKELAGIKLRNDLKSSSPKFETDETVIPSTDSRVFTGDKKVVEIDSTPNDGIPEAVSQPVVQTPVQIPSKQVEKVLV